jgi:hypothetical protein
MTTASTVATVSNANSAGFQAWVQEIYTNLVTNCGLQQLPAAMDSGQMAVPCATALPGGASTSAGYYMFRFNDALSAGPIATGNLLALTPGTGYNAGTAHTFTGVALSGGTGTGALGTVTLGALGVVSSINITTPGTGYLVGDQLTVTSANIVAAGGSAGGGSSGFAFVGSLSTTTPSIVIKMEFGTGSATANPQMWVTVAYGWASNGTLTGSAGTTATTRVTTLAGGSSLTSNTIPYISRYVYNSTLAFLGLVFKIGSLSVGTDQSDGGLLIFRTNDGNGNPTSAGIIVMTVNSSTGNSIGSGGIMQVLSQANALVYPTLGANPSAGFLSGQCCYNAANNTLFNMTSTYESGTVFVFPIYTIDPVIKFSAFVGTVFPNDLPIHTSFSAALIGATALTFLAVGLMFGGAYVGNSSQNTQGRFVIPWS